MLTLKLFADLFLSISIKLFVKITLLLLGIAVLAKPLKP
jgi:hypothetical protein